MKKGVIILVMAILMSTLVLGGNSYDLESLEDEPTQGIIIEAGDEVRFELFNETHTIIFNRINEEGFRITGYAYLKTENRMNGFATKDLSSHLDINKDGESDIIVAFYKAEVNKADNKTYATAIFQALEQTGNVVAQPEGVKLEKNYSKYLGVIGFIAFLLILIIAVRKSSSKEEETKKDSSEKETKDSEEKKEELSEESADKPSEEKKD